MRRGVEPIRDVASEADAGWIWGNSRGGGGAPLKDSQGNALTNLKLVLAGDVEADHSPSKSPSKAGRYDYDDYHAPRTSRRCEYDPYDDDEDFSGGRRRRGHGSGDGDGRRRDNYDDYDDMPPRRGGGGGRRQHNKFRDNTYEEDYDRPRDRQPLRDRNAVPGLGSFVCALTACELWQRNDTDQ